ncbi:alcohol dehydrogenase catalytic domain-containing protein [Bacillus stercoris]|nr:alcohol dehydrogenase catalytic domain-containing protein [Bacillus stercoris]
MKAVQVRKPYDLATEEIKKPVLSKGDEVLVKVKRVGICGSDMHIYHGTNPLATLPRVIGHEVTGQVEAVGANVQSLKAGDHVVIEPISYCGTCYACRKGRPNVCAKLSVFGVHEDGACGNILCFRKGSFTRFQRTCLGRKRSWPSLIR